MNVCVPSDNVNFSLCPRNLITDVQFKLSFCFELYHPLPLINDEKHFSQFKLPHVENLSNVVISSYAVAQEWGSVMKKRQNKVKSEAE